MASRFADACRWCSALIQVAGATDHVLDVGASGYSPRCFRLAGTVVGLEEDPTLARQASAAIAALGAANTKIVMGPLARGCPEQAPYDLIVLQGSTEVVPTALLKQLKNGGRLACVLGRGPAGKAMLYRMIEGDLSGRTMFDAAATLLPGFSKPPEFVF
jgi:protein-L-isoaspartate(D-aspartate) O-methyltransferase